MVTASLRQECSSLRVCVFVLVIIVLLMSPVVSMSGVCSQVTQLFPLHTTLRIKHQYA